MAAPVRVRASQQTAAITAVVCLAALSLPCVAQDTPTPTPYLVCSGCHGQQGEGNADLKAPPLAGQSATYVAQQLAKFKSGQRAYLETDEAGQAMRAISQTLESEELMLNVANFVSKLPRIDPVSPELATPLEPDRVAEGRKIFSACAGCHGERGEGSAIANAPPLALLPTWYLTKALQDFRSGARGALLGDHEGRTMRALVRLIPDDEALLALVAYIDAQETD